MMLLYTLLAFLPVGVSVVHLVALWRLRDLSGRALLLLALCCAAAFAMQFLAPISGVRTAGLVLQVILAVALLVRFRM